MKKMTEQERTEALDAYFVKLNGYTLAELDDNFYYGHMAGVRAVLALVPEKQRSEEMKQLAILFCY